MSWTQMRMVGARVLVRLHEQRSHVGAIEIPDDYRKQQETAVVLAVGPRAPRELHVGCTIVLGKWNGVEVDAPDDDPEGKGRYWVLDADHQKRGAKLAVPMGGRKYAPHTPDLYGIVEVEAGEDVRERLSSDVHRRGA